VRAQPKPEPEPPPKAIRVAGILVAAQGVLGVGFAGYLVVYLVTLAGAAALGIRAVLGEAAMFLLIGVGLLAVGLGLLRGRAWARTPAIVTQLLSLPAVYSLLGPSHQVVVGVLAGLVVLTALLSLLSEPARVWAADLDEARRRR
jgi:hypothetical protein